MDGVIDVMDAVLVHYFHLSRLLSLTFYGSVKVVESEIFHLISLDGVATYET